MIHILRCKKERLRSKLEGGFDKIIKLENIEKEITALNAEKNFQFDLTGITSHHHIEKDSSINKNIAGKRWSKIKDNIPHYQYFYTDEIRQRVSELYKADLEAYPYRFEEIFDYI